MTIRPIRLHSVYEMPCLCGTTVNSESATTTCPKCGRILESAGWPALPKGKTK